MTSYLFDGRTGLPGGSAWAVAVLQQPDLDEFTAGTPRQNEALKSKRRAKTRPITHLLSGRVRCECVSSSSALNATELSDIPSWPDAPRVWAKNSPHNTSRGLGWIIQIAFSERVLSESFPWIGCQCTKSNSQGKGKWKSNDFET